MSQIMDVHDVKKALNIGDSKAYEIIKKLNDELKEKGFVTVRGKVPTKYFNERTYGLGGTDNG